MTFKRFICKIFGHRLRGAEWCESVEYVTMNNGKPYYGKKSKKSRKKKVVHTFRKCRRCGAMIKVGKYNKY